MPALARRAPAAALTFDAAAVPRDWCADDPYATTLLAALSLLFPEGERFFVDAVKQTRTELSAADQARLDADLAGFIGQEAMHGKAHRAFNAMLVDHGFAAAPEIERRLRRFLDVIRRHRSPRAHLAVTCALEHFTALLAEALLARPAMRDELHASVRGLWLWHALEESEHKSVAFDLYRATGGGELQRLSAMLQTTAVFVAVTALAHGRLMAARGILTRPWRWTRGVVRLWIWPGHFTRLVPGYLGYFRPGFHPGQRDTSALLATWRARLFGPHGELA
jgi:uncharacterized protein